MFISFLGQTLQLIFLHTYDVVNFLQSGLFLLKSLLVYHRNVSFMKIRPLHPWFRADIVLQTSPASQHYLLLI